MKVFLTELDMWGSMLYYVVMGKRDRLVDDTKVESDAKVVIYTRIKPQTVEAIDEIRESMPFTPTRAQVIDAALAEYVRRYGKHNGRRQ